MYVCTLVRRCCIETINGEAGHTIGRFTGSTVLLENDMHTGKGPHGVWGYL